MKVTANTSISHLCLSSISSSSLFSISSMSQKLHFNIASSSFSKFSSSFLRSSSASSMIFLKSSFAKSFLSTAVYVRAIDMVYRIDVKGQTTNYGNYSALILSEMYFENCVSQFDGGAVFAIFEGNFICNYTGFLSCSSGAGFSGGAAFVIANNTNFTGSCFSSCSSERGAAFITRETLNLASMELCVFDSCYPSMSRPKYFFDIQSKDISITKSNFSRSEFSKVFRLSPIHDVKISMNQFQYINAVEPNPADEPSFFRFKRANPHMIIEKCNFVHNYIPNGDIFVFDGYKATISNWIFSNNTFSKFAIQDSASGDDITLILSFCQFDNPGSSISSALIVTQNCSFNIAAPSFISIDYVSSQQCWFHSRYKWKQPNRATQIAVLSTLAAIILVSVGFLAYHKRKLDSKIQREDEEMIAPSHP